MEETKRKDGIAKGPGRWPDMDGREEIGEGVEGVWNSLLYSERC